MRIVYFAVNNFRGLTGGLENNKIYFESSNTLFIFGQNNSGKSTFLQAYEFFYRDASPKAQDFFKQKIDKPIEFELEVGLEDLDFERIESNAPKQKDSYKQYLSESARIRLKKTFFKDSKGVVTKENQTWNPIMEEWEKTGYASIGLHGVFQSCLPTPIFIKAMPTEEEVKDVLNTILKAIAQKQLSIAELEELKSAQEKIAELQDKMYKPQVISNYEKSINDHLSKLFPDTKLNIFDKKSRMAWTENKLGKEFDIEFKKLLENGEIDEDIPSTIENIGHGTIRTAIFTLLLMRDIAEEFERKTGRKDYIVLFEEPELFLYPKIVRELRNLIYHVSEDDLPYQVLCASHSPQMIDISRPKSSILRLTQSNDSTKLFQITDQFLKEAKSVQTDEELRQAMYEVLRFNPYICESFYSDEVILVEGPTEEILSRAYLQEIPSSKDIFILNCGSITNMPFYQKVFSQFGLKYSIICDTDGTSIVGHDESENPIFDKKIQGSISQQFARDRQKDTPNTGIFRVHDTTFEPAHQSNGIPEHLRYMKRTNLGKPYEANKYWQDILCKNLDHSAIDRVPIIRYLKEILLS